MYRCPACQACGLAPSFTTLSSASHKVGAKIDNDVYVWRVLSSRTQVSLVFASAVPVDSYMNRVDAADQLEFQTEAT
eukprot:198674-Amphidinium_carterae.3